MEDKEKTREQLMEELAHSRNQVAELQDLVSRQRSENSLQLKDPKYKALFENSLEAVLLTTPDGRILDANEAACRMFGRTREELCRVGREGVVDTTDSRLADAFEQRRRNGSWRGELTLKRQDGAIFPAELSTNIFSNIDGNEITSMTIRDITEQKRAQEALRDSEIRYRTLFENMSNAVAVYEAYLEGQDFLIIDFNEAAAEIEQIPKTEVIGRSVLEVFPGVQEFGLLEVFRRGKRSPRSPHLSGSWEILVQWRES